MNMVHVIGIELSPKSYSIHIVLYSTWKIDLRTLHWRTRIFFLPLMYPIMIAPLKYKITETIQNLNTILINLDLFDCHPFFRKG